MGLPTLQTVGALMLCHLTIYYSAYKGFRLIDTIFDGVFLGGKFIKIHRRHLIL